MIEVIDDFFDKPIVKNILDFYEFSEFEDGKISGPRDRDIKHNLQIHDKFDKHEDSLAHFVTEIVTRKNRGKLDFLFPRRISPTLFLKYDEGMHYNWHNDSYVMDDVRTDYSCSVFLNDPSEYEGGELEIKVGQQSVFLKPEAGKAVVYETGLFHKVHPVTKGSRKVCVFWLESRIRDRTIRESLGEFQRLFAGTEGNPGGKLQESLEWDTYIKLQNIYFNLVRMYGDF